MSDVLSQLCPIQFIEGINENQEPILISEGPFWRPDETQVAIPYKPSRAYALSRIDIFGSPHKLPQPKEHQVSLYTDSNDAPSNNLLAEGKLIVPAQVASECWLTINLQPIVVFPKQRYWIALEDYPLKFTIGIAKDGKEIAVTGKALLTGRWISIAATIRYMLKFYGRVLPVAS